MVVIDVIITINNNSTDSRSLSILFNYSLKNALQISQSIQFLIE